jgi:hypothetical protein
MISVDVSGEVFAAREQGDSGKGAAAVKAQLRDCESI